jgi:hypothetical protein
VFDSDPNYQLLALGTDAALTYFRRLLARRIEAEGIRRGNGAGVGTLPSREHDY